jgi:uncharacterized protein
MTDAEPGIGPVAVARRIETLDILRGFAVLGILAVNAIAFAWPGQMPAGGLHGALYPATPANQWAVWCVEVLLHNRCRPLFSMLFGVSIFLVGGDVGDRIRAVILRRRLLALAVFGLIHGLALWFGDILLLYAWAGVLMAGCRSWPPKRLLWTGIALIVAFSLLESGETIAAALQSHDALRAAGGLARRHAGLLTTVDQVRSGWSGAMSENLRMWVLLQGSSLTRFVFPTLGLMMIGLSLFRSGYLAGRSSGRTYGVMLVAGLTITAAFGVIDWIALGSAEPAVRVVVVRTALDALAPVVALAWAGLLILMTRHGFGWLTRRLAPVGRMAFTNYLTQTLIMVSLFYMPWGPMLYGRVEPAPLWAIVAGVWLLQLVWSPLWLSRFETGPLEWVWRRVTYGRWTPLLKRM